MTNEVKKSVSRFEEVAYSGCFRHDGQLLVAGGEGGVVKVNHISWSQFGPKISLFRCLILPAELF